MIKLIRSLISLAIFFAVAVIILNTGLLPNDYRNCGLDCLQPTAECDSKNSTRCQKTDVIVVLSGGDTMARVGYGVNLYRIGVAPKIMFVGASAQEGVPSNAEEMAKMASLQGVSLSDIITEDQSRNTCENAKLSKSLIEQNGFKKITLVTSAYHQRRALGEFQRTLPTEIMIYNAPLTQDKDWPENWYLTPQGWLTASKETLGWLRQLVGWSC